MSLFWEANHSIGGTLKGTFCLTDSKRVFEKFFEVKFYANRLTIIRIMAR
jgi:hypothetical protein